MSRWRQAFDRIGGPDAVTWPAFWITLFTSLIGNLTTGGAVSAPLGVRVMVIFIVQLVMFAPLVLLRYTLLRNPPRPRPWVAVLGFISAAVIRGVCLSGILLAIGAVEEPLWMYRIVASLINTGGLLLVVAILVSAMRAHTRSLAQLMTVDRELVAAQARIVAEVTDRNEEALARVKARLSDEMVALDSLQGEMSVAELQRLASDVVRPMSHELASSVPVSEVSDRDIDDVHVSIRQVVSQMITRAPFRPGLNALVFAVAMFASAVGVFGLLGITLMAALAAAVALWSWVANGLLPRVLARLSPVSGIALVVIAAFIVGYLSSAAAGWVMRSTDVAQPLFIGGGAFIGVIVLLLALVTAVLRQQVAAERELAESTERLRWSVVRMRQVQWLQQKGLSRALHGPVQAVVTAAALRLDSAVRRGEATDSLLGDIRRDLRAAIDVLDVTDAHEVAFSLGLARLAGTWEGVCEVIYCIPEGVRGGLEKEPISAAIVIDLLTEAVSNAVRHAGAEQVQVSMDEPGGGRLHMVIADDGHASTPASGSTGLGTALLDECTLGWRRDTSPRGSELHVELPTASVS